MPRRVGIRLLAGIAFMGAIAAGAFVPASLAAPVVLAGATVIDVRAGGAVPGRDIVVEGDTIVAVGPAGSVRVPRGARRIDGR